MPKTQRKLSGCFFRSKNIETSKWENVVFEDLTDKEQDEILERQSNEWIKSLVKILANTINKLGDEFDIISK